MVLQKTESNTEGRDQSGITQTISENSRGTTPQVVCETGTLLLPKPSKDSRRKENYESYLTHKH